MVDMSNLPVTRVAAFLYTVPVFGLLLGEVLPPTTLAGGLVALAGIIEVEDPLAARVVGRVNRTFANRLEPIF